MESETTSQMNFKIPIVFFIGITIGVIGGLVYSGQVYQKKLVTLESSVKEEIRETLQEKGLIERDEDNAPAIPDEAMLLLGVVAEVSESSIVIESLIPNTDALAVDVLERIVIQVVEETIFIVKEPKDLEAFNREHAAWEKLLNDTDPGNIENLPEPPVSFTEKSMIITDLQVGDSVIVTSAKVVAGEDIVASIIMLEPESQDIEDLPEEIPEDPQL